MNRLRTSAKRKCKNVPNRSHGAAEQNKLTKKYPRGFNSKLDEAGGKNQST